MKVSVIGTGYVGLVSGVCLAARGHEVTCVDLDASKVSQINAGDPPIHEAGLASLLTETVGRGLQASIDLAAAVRDTELSLIAVGTPFDGSAIDLGYIRAVAAEIGAALRDKDNYHVVVVKSTVVPGTTEEVVLPILEATSGKRAGENFGVGMNPEFLREGEAITDFMHPDRIVLGGIDARTLDAMAGLYASFSNIDVLRTTPRTAEMIKYTTNALLATLISFSNEIGNLCAEVGTDVVEVMAGVHLDKRLSPIRPDGERVRPAALTYLAAGCGFGGSCFPKDVKALIAHGKSVGLPMALLDAVIGVNKAQPMRMLDLLARHLGPDLAGRRVTVLGMAFKPGTDDIRESPSLPVTQALLDAGVEVTAFDPIAIHEARRKFPALTFAPTLAEAVAGAEAVLVMTRWPEFAELPALLAERAAMPLVIDGRRMFRKDALPRYDGIGLSPTGAV